MYLMKRKVGPTINNPENIVVYYIFIVEQYKSPGTGGGGGLHSPPKKRLRVCGPFIKIYDFSYRIYDICDQKFDTLFTTWPLDQYPASDLFYS